MILWYHYAMSGLQSLKKDRCLPQDPRGSRLRVGPTQSTCLLVGALIVGAFVPLCGSLSHCGLLPVLRPMFTTETKSSPPLMTYVPLPPWLPMFKAAAQG